MFARMILTDVVFTIGVSTQRIAAPIVCSTTFVFNVHRGVDIRLDNFFVAVTTPIMSVTF